MEYLAIYLRISFEDTEDKDESNSITNQRKLIQDYIKNDKQLCNYHILEFCDDGYSGTNMERPAMQNMLKHIKENSIRCIVVKDMSRFSRDYIEMGTYLNQILPFMNIRFISINDCYDSKAYQGTTIALDTAFQTLLYDLYSKDISLKVKATIKRKCENGEFAFGQVPFGYQKSLKEKNGIIVNEKEAEIVKYIFSLAMQGMSSTKIAKKLYEENIPTPAQIRKLNRKNLEGKSATWSQHVVRGILNNRFYLGEMIYGKTVHKIVGSKKGVAVPKEDWKTIPKHHEALITEEIYEQVAVFYPEQSTKRKREKHPLTGVVYCGGCGYSLNYKPLTEKNKYRRFECRKHAILKIPECCTYMRADLLEEIILLMLNKELMIRGDAQKQTKTLISFQRQGIQTLNNRLDRYKQEKKQIFIQKDVLYENYAFKKISREEYQQKSLKMSEQLSILSVKIEDTASKLHQLETEHQRTEEDMKQIIRYLHIEELTQEVVDTFIEKVYVYKGKKVDIRWKFCNEMYN